MCRLALMNKVWMSLVTEVEMKELFETLNTKNGGHGVGIALCYEKNPPVIHKGLMESPSELASIAYGELDNPDFKYLIYHARMASSGEMNDEMCHPFSEGTLFGLTLAHNGVIQSLSGSDTYSDTAILFDMITKYGLPFNTLKSQSGVFVGLYKKFPYVVKANSYSELSIAYTPDYEGWCFCSNFYQFRHKFEHRFIVDTNLGTFVWSKKLKASDISKMYDPNYYSNTSKSWSRYTGKEDYYIKQRTYMNTTTWHDYECTDWYCDGECLEKEEK